MFNELEALRAQCAMQQARIDLMEGVVATQQQQMLEFRHKIVDDLHLKCAKLAAQQENLHEKFAKQRLEMCCLEGKLKRLDEDNDNQRTLNLLLSIRTVTKVQSSVPEPPQVAYEGMRLRRGPLTLQYGSHTFFKNSVIAHKDENCDVSIHGTGARVEIFKFQAPTFNIKDFFNTYWGVKEGEWTLLVETPFEFIQERPMVVYHRFVEGIEAQSSLKLPPSYFYIFKYAIF